VVRGIGGRGHVFGRFLVIGKKFSRFFGWGSITEYVFYVFLDNNFGLLFVATIKNF
jgi:hypothetical protein